MHPVAHPLEFDAAYYEAYGDYEARMAEVLPYRAKLIVEAGFRTVLVIGSGYGLIFPELLKAGFEGEMVGIEMSEHARTMAGPVALKHTLWTTRHQALSQLQGPFDYVEDNTLQYLTAETVEDAAAVTAELVGQCLLHGVFYEGIQLQEGEQEDVWRRVTRPKLWWDKLFNRDPEILPDVHDPYLYWRARGGRR